MRARHAGYRRGGDAGVSEVPGGTSESLAVVTAFGTDRTQDPPAGPAGRPRAPWICSGTSGTPGVLVSLLGAAGFWLTSSEVRRPEGSSGVMLPDEGFGVFTRST